MTPAQPKSALSCSGREATVPLAERHVRSRLCWPCPNRRQRPVPSRSWSSTTPASITISSPAMQTRYRISTAAFTPAGRVPVNRSKAMPSAAAAAPRAVRCAARTAIRLSASTRISIRRVPTNVSTRCMNGSGNFPGAGWICVRKLAARSAAEVFQMDLPDPLTGACPAGGVPIYRVFNQRVDANHRYTTSRRFATRWSPRRHRRGLRPEA